MMKPAHRFDVHKFIFFSDQTLNLVDRKCLELKNRSVVNNDADEDMMSCYAQIVPFSL